MCSTGGTDRYATGEKCSGREEVGRLDVIPRIIRVLINLSILA